MKTTSFVIWGVRRLGQATPLYGNAIQSLFQVVSSALSSLPIPIMDLFVFSRAPVDTGSYTQMAALKMVGRIWQYNILTMIVYTALSVVCRNVCIWSVCGL